ncbi:MAG: anti-sigma factor family protein [Gammaproteobacteria bacterium]
MHATTEQLLSLRDGQPVDAASAAHVAGCAQCRRRLDALSRMRAQLRGLPELAPPGDLWRMVAVHAVARTRRPRRQWTQFAGLAAGLVLGVALLVNLAPRTGEAPLRGTTTDLVASTPAPASSVNGVTRAELLETSRRLEAALRALPAAPRVTRASTALTIAELQDRIYEVDLVLSDPRLDPARERALWQQRVTLMDTLMRVRYSQLSDAR